MKRKWDIDDLVLIQKKDTRDIDVFRILGYVKGVYHVQSLKEKQIEEIPSNSMIKHFTVLYENQRELRVFSRTAYDKAIEYIKVKMREEGIDVKFN